MSQLKTINSLSGGRSSAFVGYHWPADYNVFALVRIEDESCRFPDRAIARLVEDRIQADFIGTAEDDMIIYTMLDLEQFTGRRIDWVTGPTFDELIGKKKTVPNYTQRFCTEKMKIEPIAKFIYENGGPMESRIGFRVNEQKRAASMLEKCDKDGFTNVKIVVGESANGRKKWKTVQSQKPVFPLIDQGINKADIIKFWAGKPVRFAPHNNCVGCFHRHPLFLSKMAEAHPEKMEWFASKETVSSKGKLRTWRSDTTYRRIIDFELQLEIGYEEFSPCDSGFCGL